jgi:hypothetical protein
MKYFTLLSLVVLFAACQHPKPKPKPFVSKSDTVRIIACRVKGGPLYDMKGAYYTKQIFAPVVYGETEGYYSVDTIWNGYYATGDTARDPKGKPIYDSAAKQYKAAMAWQPVLKQYVEIVDVPRLP